MKRSKRRKLEKAGWRVVSVRELLGLSDAEAALVDVKARLALELLQLRTKMGLTQSEVARRVESSQSRVAKMEANDGSTSLDLLVRSLVVLGATPSDIGRSIAGSRRLAPQVSPRAGRHPRRRRRRAPSRKRHRGQAKRPNSS